MNLIKLRTEKGVTQKEVADYLGCDYTVYAKYERGDRSPSYETIIKLADYFNSTVDYLIGRDGAVRQRVTSEQLELINSPLTEYEFELLMAARKADKRAREDALRTLQAHEVPEKKEDLA